MNLRKRVYISIEAFTLSGEAAWSYRSSVVNHTHWLVAQVPWDLHRLVLNDVLLNNGSSNIGASGLLPSQLIHISLGDEPIVAGNVRSYLRGSN